MNGGFIKIHRKLQDWEWYDDSHMLHLFIHLLLSANYEDDEWHGIKVKRGQLITGLDSLSLSTGISKRSLRTCLMRLKTTGELTYQSTNRFRIINILKYEQYQSIDRKSTVQTTVQRHSSDKQTTASKNTKEYKEYKKYPPKNSFRSESGLPRLQDILKSKNIKV